MKLFISPHSDDACLFGAYTLQREHPLVLTVFDSYVQVDRGNESCNALARRNEDIAAMGILGCDIAFGRIPDNIESSDKVIDLLHLLFKSLRYEPDEISDVWLPECEDNGHDQHNLVAIAGNSVFAGTATLHRYPTYTRTSGKSTHGTEVQPTGAMVRKKLQALAEYKTQLEIDALGCWPHFMDLREFTI